jgi:hypothetical protein
LSSLTLLLAIEQAPLYLFIGIEGADIMIMKILTNKRFGKLKVISLNEERTNKENRALAYWNCLCDCGNTSVVRSSALISGRSQSCGCNHHKLGKNNSNFTGFEEIGGRYWNNLKKTSILTRKLAFDIIIQDAWALFLKQNRCCALTGMELQFQSKDSVADRTASLDRIDSSKGYIEGNVQWVHKDINYIKNDYSQNYFIELCNKVVNHQNQSLNTKA